MLSTYLFIIMEEVLTQMINVKVAERKINLFLFSLNASKISHLLHVDDVVMFANASKSTIRCLIEIFKTYEAWMDQLINYDKSIIHFSKWLSHCRLREVLVETGFVRGHFSFNYLGALIVDGRLKIVHFKPLLEGVAKMLAGWKNLLLS